jgi:hypothetical protein
VRVSAECAGLHSSVDSLILSITTLQGLVNDDVQLFGRTSR